jgi:hypothetical protein
MVSGPESGFCNVGDFINAMTIGYVGQNMLEYEWKF